VEINRALREVLKKYGLGSLGITDLVNKVFDPAFAIVLAILDILRKSGYTVEIAAQDKRRDDTARGFYGMVQALTHHPDPKIRAAAIKIREILRHYGDLTKRAYDDASSAIDDLGRELRSAEHAALLTTIGANDWLELLETENAKFVALMLARYGEAATRPTARMKQARRDLDAALREILKRVEAHIPLYGLTSPSANYAPFVAEWNDIATRYKNLLAQEKGRRTKKNEEGREEL
jgi:hypothetical protein